MILYEVNLEVDAEIASDYLAWLDAHVREIRALPGFLGAELFDDAGRSSAACACNTGSAARPISRRICAITHRACARTVKRASAGASARRGACCSGVSTFDASGAGQGVTRPNSAVRCSGVNPKMWRR